MFSCPEQPKWWRCHWLSDWVYSLFWSWRPVTFETFDQSDDEETWPNQHFDNFYNLYSFCSFCQSLKIVHKFGNFFTTLKIGIFKFSKMLTMTVLNKKSQLFISQDFQYFVKLSEDVSHSLPKYYILLWHWKKLFSSVLSPLLLAPLCGANNTFS